MDQKKIYRIIDANFNRGKEGLRVCEDVCRFIFDQKAWTREFKNIRHELTTVIGSLKVPQLILARDTDGDVGTASSKTELRRRRMRDIFYANIQRVKESLRVLEELLKLYNVAGSQKLKKMRYRIYALEKKVAQKRQGIFNP